MESESLKSGTLNFWKCKAFRKRHFQYLTFLRKCAFGGNCDQGGHFDGSSASLKCKSESPTQKLQIWARLLTNHSFFIRDFKKISMRIYENQLFFERKSKIWTRLQKIICFSKENWHRGGTEKIEKSAVRAASAIGVFRIFKSGVFAWRFFDFFRTAPNETPTFESENDIGEEAVRKSCPLGPQGRVY